MALFRVDFSGRGELSERQQKLAQMLSRLQKLSEEFNLAVFVTNQMTSDPGATMSFQVSWELQIVIGSLHIFMIAWLHSYGVWGVKPKELIIQAADSMSTSILILVSY